MAAAPPRIDRSLVSALVGNFLVRLDGGIVGIMMTLYLADIDQRGLAQVSAVTVGILASIFYIVELTFSPVMGAKSDQHGNRALLLVAPFVGVVAVALAGSAAFFGEQGLVQVSLAGVSVVLLALGLTRMLQGFAAAASIPSILSYLSARTEGSLALRGRVMSIFEVTTGVGLLLGPVLGAQLWKYAGIWGFVLTGLIFLASAAFFWPLRDASAVRRRDITVQGVDDPLLVRLRRLLRRRDLLVFAPAWLAVNAIVGLWGVHFVYQMRNGRLDDDQFLTGRFDPNVISAALLGFGLVFCVGIIIWGFVLGRLRELTIMRLSVAGLFGVCVAAFGINAFGEDPTLRWLFVGLAALLLLVESGFAPAAVAYLARLAAGSAGDRGLLMGLYSVVLGLGQFIGQYIGGYFANAGGVNGIIVLSLLLGLVAAYTMLRLEPQPITSMSGSEKLDATLHAH